METNINHTLMQEFAKLFSASDMPNEDTRWLAENIGIENTMKVILNFKGMALYIAGEDLIKRLKKKYVSKMYDGENVRQLARKLEVSERTIYRWIDEKAEKTNQFDLFTGKTPNGD